jgi:hypothetical protein
MSKTFTFAGTCTENGAVVYKFANDANRAKALERFGCTDINMIQLPFAMGKEEAVDWLNRQGITATKAVKPATVKVKAAKTTKVVATKAKDTDSDEVTKEAYAEAMSERKANGMPVVSFAQYKRDAAKAVAFFAKCDSKLAIKREAGQTCF